MRNKKSVTDPDIIGFWYEYDGLEFGGFHRGTFAQWLYNGGTASDFFSVFSRCKEDAYELFEVYKQKTIASRAKIRNSKKEDISWA